MKDYGDVANWKYIKYCIFYIRFLKSSIITFILLPRPCRDTKEAESVFRSTILGLKIIPVFIIGVAVAYHGKSLKLGKFLKFVMFWSGNRIGPVHVLVSASPTVYNLLVWLSLRMFKELIF